MSAYIDGHRDRFGVEPICRTLGVSASAYYHRATGARCDRAIGDEWLLGQIRELHAANYYAYGYRKWRARRHFSDRATARPSERCARRPPLSSTPIPPGWPSTARLKRPAWA